MKKLCYIINTDWYFDLHWVERANAARKSGYTIHVIACFGDGNIKERLEFLGFNCHNVNLDAPSFNPLNLLSSFKKIKKHVDKINPDLLHCITIKTSIIGGLLAKLNNTPVILSFAGLGRVFMGNGLFINTLRRIIISVFRAIAENKRCILMFEHDEDRNQLVKLTGISPEKTVIVDGAGVDPDIYSYSQESTSESPVVLFAARLLWSKGIGDLVAAKKILNERGINFKLHVAGIIVDDDSDAIPISVIEGWHRSGLICWLGRSNDIHHLIKSASIVALPSVYAEGIPRILLEASSVGRPCIAYNIGGCKSFIADKQTGLLVERKSITDLATKLEYLIANPEARIAMGRKGREQIEKKYANKLILEKTLEIYRYTMSLC